MLHAANGKPAKDVDRGDDHTRHRLATNEPAGAVHGGEEVGLPLQFEPHPPCLLPSDRAGVDFGVDRHLPARQTVERESGGHLARPCGAGGDHHELHDRDDREDHAADHQVVGGDKLAKGLHPLARGRGAVEGRTGEDQPGRGDVEHEPHERDPEQKRGKHAHVEGRAGRKRPEQRQHRHGEVDRQQDVDQGRRHGREHDHHGQEDGRGDREVHDVGGEGPTEGRRRAG